MYVQRFGQTQLEFVSNAKTALTRRPRTGTSKVWECAKVSLDMLPKERSECDIENIIKFSKRLPFFKYVSTGAREALCRSMQHMVLQEGELVFKGPMDMDYVWFIVVKGRCDMMLKTEKTGKFYPMRAFEEGDTFAFSYLKMLSGDSKSTHQQGQMCAREANTCVVRVFVEAEHRADFRSQTKPLLYEELAKYFNMAADQAADKLGLCMSAIKKICRRHGIIRWPHRKLLSANKSLALIDSKMQEVQQTPQVQAGLRHEAIGVVICKLRVMLNPIYLVNSELVQVQPSAACGHQAAARGEDAFELEASLSPNSDDNEAGEAGQAGQAGHASEAGEPTASGAKRKNQVKVSTTKEGKMQDKKARMNEQRDIKPVRIPSRARAAPGKPATKGAAWKAEKLSISHDNGAQMLVALASMPMRSSSDAHSNPRSASMQLAESSHAHHQVNNPVLPSSPTTLPNIFGHPIENRVGTICCNIPTLVGVISGLATP